MTAFAGWQRHINGASGIPDDSPGPHPLQYFLTDLCSRPSNDSIRRGIKCTSQQQETPTPEFVEIGKIRELSIYDVYYSRPGDFYPYVRSVLVKVGRDQFRELDVFIGLGQFVPSEVVHLSGEPILVAKSRDGGNHNRVDENLYLFRPNGPASPDFRAVGEAIRKLLPLNMSIRTANDDYSSMTLVVETYRNDLNLPPVSVTERGRITVTYRFVNGRAIVTSAEYSAYSLNE
jgi:hypothetical protein